MLDGPSVQKLGHRRNAGGQFEVGGRAGHGVQPAPPTDCQVVFAQVHHVVAAAAVLKRAERIELLDRAHAIAPVAALHLALRLGQMRIERLMQRLRQLGHLPQERFARGILGVDADAVADERMQRVEMAVFPLGLPRAAAMVVRRADQRHAEPRRNGRVYRLVEMEIHIEHRRLPARHIFEDCQPHERIDVAAGQLPFQREHLLVEPLGQRQIVRMRAQERHAGVRVRVLKPRQQQAAPAVDLAVERGPALPCGADIHDAVVFDPYLARQNVRHAGKLCNFCMKKSNVHGNSIPNLLS